MNMENVRQDVHIFERRREKKGLNVRYKSMEGKGEEKSTREICFLKVEWAHHNRLIVERNAYT
jgi:hypothetical protein